MTPERWTRVREIFEAAAGRAPESRAAFVDQACAGDAELLQEVESLLASAEGVSSSFLDSPAVAGLSGLALGESRDVHEEPGSSPIQEPVFALSLSRAISADSCLPRVWNSSAARSKQSLASLVRSSDSSVRAR